MARLTKQQWKALRTDFEVAGMSLNALSAKYGADKGNISKRAKRDCWEKEKVQPIILRKINALKQLTEANAEITTLSNAKVVDIDREVETRLRMEGMYMNSLEYNQALANQQLQALGDNAALFDINIHSQITNRNKEGALGKQPQQVQVTAPDKKGIDANAIMDRLRKKHQ